MQRERNMQVQEAMKKRKSVRSYLDKPVEKEKIDKILEAAQIAPSARNSQEWRIIVVTDKDVRRRLAEAARNQMFVAEAPVVFVCCAETDKANMTCGHSRYTVDCSIAVDHMMLAAVEEGLGTCWIGAFTQEPVRKLLDIPKDIEVFALLPTGYPTDPAAAEKRRKPMNEIACYDSWKL
jgi:nitroreductase